MMLGLSEGQLASHPGQQDRLGVCVGEACSPALRTFGGLPNVLLATPNEFPLGKQTSDLVADLAGQIFQVDKRASSGQFPLMLPSQSLRGCLNPIL